MRDAIRRLIDRLTGRSKLREQLEYYEWLTEHNGGEFVKTMARISEDNHNLREAVILSEEAMRGAIYMIGEGYSDEAIELLRTRINDEEEIE